MTPARRTREQILAHVVTAVTTKAILIPECWLSHDDLLRGIIRKMAAKLSREALQAIVDGRYQATGHACRSTTPTKDHSGRETLNHTAGVDSLIV